MTEKSYEELIERRGVLAAEADKDDADLDAIEKEIRDINAEIERRKAAEADEKAQAEKREELRKMIANGAGEPLGNFKAEKEKRDMPDIKEIRSSAAYMNAWVEDIKKGEMVATRTLLTENGIANAGENDGIVPVPTYVEDRIRAAWENNAIASRIRRTYFRGNLKIGYEASSTGAVVHEENGEAIEDEELMIGIVQLIPEFIKKAITLSDTVLAMRGQEFLDYVFDEFENKIVALLCAKVIDAITNAPATNQPTAIGVPEVTADVATLDIVAQALAELTNENAVPVVVMNRGTYAAFRAAQLSANYAVDPFEGCERIFSSRLPSLANASEEETWMIVGDLSAVQGNFPDGDQVSFIIDPYTQKRRNLVEILGKLNVAVGITEPGMLVRVKKASL